MAMQQHQRREVQDWLNLFEQQKQSGQGSGQVVDGFKIIF